MVTGVGQEGSGGVSVYGDACDNEGTEDGGVFDLCQDLRVEGKGGTWNRRWRVCTANAKRRMQYSR